MQSTITRRHALALTAAGTAVLAAGIGAAAALPRPKRHSGAWFFREYTKINIHPHCGVGPDGRPVWIGFSFGESMGAHWERHSELNQLMRDDPRADAKLTRHCIKVGRWMPSQRWVS